MRRRGRPEVIPAELRDKYYFIDYLRLHRFGKQNEIWKKNRNMLVREHEYDTDVNTRARKGYKSYIQRCMKSILDWMYPDFNVMKPRNRFAYEIGERSGPRPDLLKLSEKSEDKVKFILQRYLLNREYADIVLPYRDLVSSSPSLSFKNNEAGIVIGLDENRSFGYEAIRDIQKIRAFQDEMIAIADDVDALFVNMLKSGLDKSLKLPAGTPVQVLNNRGATTDQLGVVSETRMLDGYQGTETRISVDFPNGNHSRYLPAQLILNRSGETVVSPEVTGSGSFISRIIDYANENFDVTSGIDTFAIFTLSRAAIVRELVSNGDINGAGELRRLEATDDILNQINVQPTPESTSEDENDDWDENTDYDGEDEEFLDELAA